MDNVQILLIFILIVAVVLVLLSGGHIISRLLHGGGEFSGGAAKKKVAEDASTSAADTEKPSRSMESRDNSDKFFRLRVNDDQLRAIRSGTKTADVRLSEGSIKDIGEQRKKILYWSESGESVAEVKSFSDKSLKELLSDAATRKKIFGKDISEDDAKKAILKVDGDPEYKGWYKVEDSAVFRLFNIEFKY